ncbi:hypothetical protein [Sphingorhabdus contaminans]|uniref:hypothetical protein n=1 Tax=Sphingorhabdus contaminans TaxID=1343899 RepID=UPI003D29B491
MSKIVVALNAYVLPDDHKIFKCSPGKTYRFYQEVKRTSTVFLDIRGLNDLHSDPREWSDKEVLEIIADDRWNRELQSRARGNKEVGTEGVGRTDRTILGFLKALLGEAKKGDLIVVPVEGYNKDVLVGELLDHPWDVKSIEAQDGDYTGLYVGRRVKWMAGIPKRFLSGDLITALHTQTAFFQLGVSLHEEIYRLAYKNFVYRNNYIAEFFTSKQHFTSEDSAVLSAWLNGFEYLRYRISTGDVAGLPQSFVEMGLEKLPDNIAADLSININSPGAFVLKSSGAFAMSLMAMLALSGCDAQEVIDEGVEIELKTVGTADSTCSIEVAKEVENYAKTLSYKRLEKACELGLRAQEDAKVTAQARLK